MKHLRAKHWTAALAKRGVNELAYFCGCDGVDMLSDWECEARLIYSLIVAGKSAEFAERKTVALLDGCAQNISPFEYMKELVDSGRLDSVLRSFKVGNYCKLAKAIPEVIKLDAQTCALKELEAVHGIGPKTSRFFLMWTRPDQRYAALDTHILKWLRAQGYDAPKSTPTGQKYLDLEQTFLKEADERGMKPRELDAEIWAHYATGGQLDIPISAGHG